MKIPAERLAVHCKQTGGGQYIDVGLIDVVEQPAETATLKNDK